MHYATKKVFDTPAVSVRHGRKCSGYRQISYEWFCWL